MPRYFFDIHDGGPQRDDTGTELADLDDVRARVRRLLPDLARDDLGADGDRRVFTVLVTDEDGRGVYAATLNFTGMRLSR
ncbi:hypothetical protein U8607_11305 [Methylobacterium durans]|uniref:DUF6894 family protein n=1 Tax=Methylobacterium durans TaxID=2202825 RepID=UPI002AFED749|nr:hypothetical protein [Methylobacterium durans]MEA1832668.1 hypothetical protein [Methylobacterium durans]